MSWPLARSSVTDQAGSGGIRSAKACTARSQGARSATVAASGARSTDQRVAAALAAVRRAAASREGPRNDRSSVSAAASCRRRVAAWSRPRPSAITTHTPVQRTACSMAQRRAPASYAGTSTRIERSCSRASGQVRGSAPPNMPTSAARIPRTRSPGAGQAARPTHATRRTAPGRARSSNSSASHANCTHTARVSSSAPHHSCRPAKGSPPPSASSIAGQRVGTRAPAHVGAARAASASRRASSRRGELGVSE